MEEEFREFVAARSGALLRSAYLLAGDWATAEDLLQTALTKTYLAWKRLSQIDAIEPYTRRVLVNTATSWWRRRWHGERPTEVLPERPAPDRHEEALERDAMWQHVRRLPARQRAVLVLRFYEDLSEAQTAELLEISPGTVKSQTARALATLRKRLAADGVAPSVRPAAPPPTPSRQRAVPSQSPRSQSPPSQSAPSESRSSQSRPSQSRPSPSSTPAASTPAASTPAASTRAASTRAASSASSPPSSDRAPKGGPVPSPRPAPVRPARVPAVPLPGGESG